MATHIGKEGNVKVGVNTIAEVTDWSLDQTADPVEDSELTDEWKTFKSGTDLVKEFTGTITAWYDETDTNGQVALTVGASFSFDLRPEGDTTGDEKLTGTAIVGSIAMGATRGAIITRTFSFQGSGALTIGTVA